MGLNDTPRGERLHIALFGRRNAGKSSIINALTNQNIAIVSDQKGTTTDPVYKAMELLPLGPVVMIDTPGLDDEGDLGLQRVKKAKEVLGKTDIALIVADSSHYKDLSFEIQLMDELKDRKIPFILLLNKYDLILNPSYESSHNTEVTRERLEAERKELEIKYNCKILFVSAVSGDGMEETKEQLGKYEKIMKEGEKRIVGDLLEPGDFVILVVPIDKAAPKGRLILPQQQTIRDILDTGAVSIVVRDTELAETLERLGTEPKLVITDSQAFGKVSKIVPKDMPLTSFSILFARYKGELADLIEGARTLERLEDGDMILMGEGCTHHRQCDDIGTVKIPNMIRKYTGKQINIETSSGGGFPEDLTKYKMVVHCGGCTLNEKEMKSRIQRAKDQGIPMVNYGILIAYMNGILERSIEPLKDTI